MSQNIYFFRYSISFGPWAKKKIKLADYILWSLLKMVFTSLSTDKPSEEYFTQIMVHLKHISM
jgi:hypothetical protein